MALDQSQLTVSEAHAFRQIRLDGGSADLMRHSTGRWTLSFTVSGGQLLSVTTTIHLTTLDMAALAGALTAAWAAQQQAEEAAA